MTFKSGLRSTFIRYVLMYYESSKSDVFQIDVFLNYYLITPIRSLSHPLNFISQEVLGTTKILIIFWL